MEDWTADSDEPKKFSQDRLDGCDLCVLLVAFRRGYVPDGETRSITQLEYAAALKRGMDILPFMLDENAPWQRNFDELEKDPEIVKWRADLRKRHGVQPFGLEPRSIDMTGSLGRWLAKRNAGQTEKSNISRINWPEGKSPYPGLLSFDQEYAELFFGRDREVAEVIAKMCDPGGRFLITSGASGSGKSSLVGAGLWRALIKEDRIPGSRAWEWLRIQPGDGTAPFEPLAWGLKQKFPRVPRRPQDLANELIAKKTTVAELLGSQLSQERELVLFIDQLEELYTQPFEDKDIRSFLEELIATTRDKNSRLRVVTTVRSEFIARLEESESVLELLNAGYNYHLGPVSPRALQDMIEKPAQATGYDFEPGLVEDVLREAAQEPGALPLVAYALKQLFDRRRERSFTRDAYQEIRGVAGAIGTQADQVISGLDTEALGAFDRVFAELVHIERDRPPTRKRVTLAAFKMDQGANKLINVLSGQDCRVLLIGDDKGEPTVEVAHEKLFTAWAKLTNWIDKSGDALRSIEHAKEEAQRWWDRGAKVDELWDADRAAEVVSAMERVGKASGEPLNGFIHPSSWLIERIKKETLSHEERLKIGIKLGEFGDPRPGVKLRLDGLPNIKWVDIEPGKVRLWRVEQVFDVKPFRIAKYPVTNLQFQAFVNAEDGYGNAEWWKGIKQIEGPAEATWKEANSPREKVSWFEAVAFSRWLSKRTGEKIRLPTEWEWQLAATGGDPTHEYPWAGGWEPARCNSYESRLNRTSAVGMYPSGTTEQGVLDMAGNVWEWCLNKYEQPGTPEALQIDNDERGQRVMRGGSWGDLPEHLRASVRYRGNAVSHGYTLGFRLAQDLE